jgi:hypothetical protein
MCDVFFFGTAFNIDSHIPSRSPGTLSCIAEGSAKPRAGSTGRESCLEDRVANLEVLDGADAENRGRKYESIERVVTWAAAILISSN